MKSRAVIITEAVCYIGIASGAPFVELLISDRVLTARSLTATTVIAIILGLNAMKAYLSQSLSNREPLQVVAPPGEPLEVVETQPEQPSE